MSAIPMLDYAEQSHKQPDLYTTFLQLDLDEDGFVTKADLYHYLSIRVGAFHLTEEERRRLLHWTDIDMDCPLSYEQFCLLLAKTRRQMLRQTIYRMAQIVVPKRDREKAFSYLAQYSCFPPPVFILLATLTEIAVYIYYAAKHETAITLSGPVPVNSPLIYDPCRRYQAWRYISYCLLHVGIHHLITNCLVQVIVGIPLELVHKNWRIGLIYVSGVLAGSLSVSLADSRAYLAGASGGGYALLAAHLANLVINWSEMEYALIRAACLAIVFSADLGLAIYSRYGVVHEIGRGVEISYAAHLGGFLVGVFLGIIILRNLRYRRWEKFAMWISIGVLLFLFMFAVLWNILSPTFQYVCS